MMLNVSDVDSFVAHALGVGAAIERPIADQFYGHREGTVKDPFGYLWNVSMVKEEMSVEEMHRRMEAMMKRDTASQKPAVNPVPRGFRTVTPYMIAEDGPALLEFAKQAFGAEEMFRAVGTAGGLHGEVRIGDSMLMMGGGIPGREFTSTPNTHALHVYVKNTDAVYQKALTAGATTLQEPADQDYGERSASVKDPAGNHWYIATRLEGNYKWEGAPDVQPYLHPLRAEPVINFLKRAFGAQETGRYTAPDGVVHHTTIKVGESFLEMGEAHGPYQPMKSMFYLYVPHVDAVYRTAPAAGGKCKKAP